MIVQVRTLVTCIVFSIILLAHPCFAHKVRIFAWNEGNTIHTESKFSGGKPAQHATVTVIDSSTGSEVLQGTTDEQGLFQFPVPDSKSNAFDIIVNSGDGHKNSWHFELTPSSVKKSASSAATASTPTPQPLVTPAISEEQLTRLMERVLEEKLAPIRRQLAENEERSPSIQDILGGIGYILGLAGIAAFMKSKKN
jgi:nickel transport protein